MKKKSLVGERDKNQKLREERKRNHQSKKKKINETRKVLRINAGRFTCDKVDFY